MATLEELVVQLTAETSGLKASMNAAVKITEESTNKMEKAMKEFSDNSSKNVGFFQSAMATMAGFVGGSIVTGAIDKLTNALGSAFDLMKSGIDDAEKQQAAMLRLANAMQLAGNYSSQAVDGIAKMANTLEEQTGVADDAIIANAAYLSSLTRLSGEGLQRATEAALNLSAATGVDLQAATSLIAKGIEGNVSAFKRYGIVIEEGATKAETMEKVLTTLNTRFGGAAAGNIQTYGGAITALKNSFGNLIESFGSAIVDNKVVVETIKALAKALGSMQDGADSAASALRTGIAEGLIFVIKTTMVAIETVDVFARTFEVALRSLLLPVNGLADGVRTIVDMLDGSIDQMGSNSQKQWEDISTAISGDSSLDKLNGKLGDILVSANVAFGEMKNGADGVAPTIQKAGKAVAELTLLQQMHKDEVKAFSEELLKSGASVSGYYQNQQSLLQATRDANLITDETYFENSLKLLAAKQEKEDAMLKEWRDTNKVNEEEYQTAKTALEQKQTVESVNLQKKKQDAEKAASDKRIADLNSTFGTIATMASSSNQTLASIGKAAAVAQATMDTYAAANVALRSAPPPFNFALAAAVTAAGIANVAKITNTNLATGIDRVPGVGTRDNFPAMLQPGERVVPSETNQDLTDFLSRQSSQPQQINVTINIPNPIPLNREAAESMVEALNNYFTSGGLRLINT